MRIVLNPAAFTRLIKAWVTTGFPQAVSLGMPLLLASSELPRFQPAPMSATTCGPASGVTTPAEADRDTPYRDPAKARVALRKASPTFRFLELMIFPLVGLQRWTRPSSGP